MDNNNQQLARFDNTKFIDIINRIPNLTEEDKHMLALRVASDDAEIRKIALQKIEKSLSAQNDLNMLMDLQAMLNKQGMYMKSKQTIETASGKFEIEMKGGDTKLIIPVLIILGIVVIAALVIIFWK
jgi:hypothetical protein